VSRAAVASAPVWLQPDRVLLVIAVALLPIGLVAISSASVGYAEATLRHMWHHSLRHLVYLVAGPGGRGVVCYSTAGRVLVPQRLAVAAPQSACC
jgi:cell division protein FtsW